MKKRQNKPQTPAERYPELDMLAGVIAQNIAIEINQVIEDNINLVRTKCLYPHQCVLEMVIAKLEAKV